MIGDNIKKLRNELGMTQANFAARIKLTQGAIASVESGKRELSRQSLMSISREFGVRLEWLETGEGEMYKQADTSILAQLESTGSLTPKGRELIELYLKMPPNVQDLIADAIAAAAELYPRKTEAEQPFVKPNNELTPDEAAEVVRHERAAVLAAKKEETSTSSAFTGTSGLSKKSGRSP